MFLIEAKRIYILCKTFVLSDIYMVKEKELLLTSFRQQWYVCITYIYMYAITYLPKSKIYVFLRKSLQVVEYVIYVWISFTVMLLLLLMPLVFYSPACVCYNANTYLICMYSYMLGIVNIVLCMSIYRTMG